MALGMMIGREGDEMGRQKQKWKTDGRGNDRRGKRRWENEGKFR